MCYTVEQEVVADETITSHQPDKVTSTSTNTKMLTYAGACDSIYQRTKERPARKAIPLPCCEGGAVVQ